MMTAKLFEAALGITSPWYINGVDFDVATKSLTLSVDFCGWQPLRCPGDTPGLPSKGGATLGYTSPIQLLENWLSEQKQEKLVA